MARTLPVVLACWLVVPLVATRTSAAEPQDAWKLLPQRPLLYVQVESPAELVSYVMDHPLRPRLESSPVYQQAYQSEQYKKFQVGRVLVESQLGRKWPAALEALAGEGIHLAYDPEHEGAVVLVRAKDPAYAREMGQQLAKWVQHVDKAAEVRDYRGAQVVRAKNGVTVAVWDGWIGATSKAKLLQQVVDRHHDGGPSLHDNQRFAATAATAGDNAAWAWADLQMLRESGVAKDVFTGKSENPAAELLLGGIVSTLQHSDHLLVTLKARGPHLQLAAAMPHQAAWGEGPREHFFGPAGKGVAPGVLQVDGQVFSLAAYRDIARMWLQADDLFPAQMVDSLAEADANLSTLFGGRDFGEDVLASLEPQVQLVVARQEFATLPKPAIRLPGFALAATLKEPEVMRRDLRRVYQNLIGFLNIVGAMEGNPQMDMDSKTEGETTLHWATFVAEPEERTSETARIQFNFTPSVAFSGDRFVVSSSADLARRLASAEAAPPSGDNTVAQLNAAELRKVLEDNKTQLIAKNILEKGSSREEADAEISTALDLASLIESVRLRLTATEQLRLQLDVTLAP